MTTHWQDQAACIGEPISTFFPETAGGHDPYKRARKLCGSCPVRDECLEHAVTQPERFGMWGGTTPVTRGTRFKYGEALGKNPTADRIVGLDVGVTPDYLLPPVQPEFDLYERGVVLEDVLLARRRRREILDRIDAELAGLDDVVDVDGAA